MTFSRWGFIYLGTGAEDPARDRATIEAGGLTTEIVAVPTREEAVAAAVELVERGAQSIELCGGFGTAAVARVVAAVGDRVPVGAVAYGQESIGKLTELFAPAAA